MIVTFDALKMAKFCAAWLAIVIAASLIAGKFTAISQGVHYCSGWFAALLYVHFYEKSSGSERGES